MRTPHFANASVVLYAGDCIEILRDLDDASVDAVVTDPPYGLEFMGKAWDSFGGDVRQPGDPTFTEGTGPFSRAKVRHGMSPAYRSKAAATPRQEGGIPQASGPSFLGGLNPKCLACDKWQRGSNPCRCDSPEWTQERLVRLHSFQEWCEAWSRECLRVLRPGGHMLAFGGTRTFHRLACAVEDAGFEIRDSIAWMYGSGFPKSLNLTDADGERTGWGTALKPAFEPIVMARKPLAGTVAANVAAHGTGALNIDGCRIALSADEDADSLAARSGGVRGFADQYVGGTAKGAPPTDLSRGRWPANVVLDESQAEVLDDQSGETQARVGKPRGADSGDGWGMTSTGTEYSDLGGASRFFYVAKADASERVRIDGVAHPTVKPLSLMRWLVRLVTPPGGTVLEPFAGSGTTVEACLLEGFQCIAIEREADYLPLIRQRIHRRRDPVAAIRATGEEDTLFGSEASA